ncbi:hypothetical protein uan_107 [Pseudomonas phage UAntarctica]|nr:hypothetical protein uan_107 [Pseudomonas phage UAntarctica]
MKKVTVHTTKGPLEVMALHVWNQQIMGMDFGFALHPQGVKGRGVDPQLAISELSSGFNTGALIYHPNSRNILTVKGASALSKQDLKRRSRSALHHHLKKVGESRFVEAVIGGRTQVVLDELLDKGISLEVPSQSAVDQLLGSPCETCDGSKVVSTTDTDQDGNHIEAACPACIPKAIGGVGYRFDEAMTPGDPAAGCGGPQSIPKQGSKRLFGPPGEWEITQSPGDPAAGGDGVHEEYVPTQEEVDAALEDADAMNQNMARYGTIDAPPKFTLPELRKQLAEAEDLAAQHGTMTGDLTEGDYEDLCDCIESLKEQIQQMEQKA